MSAPISIQYAITIITPSDPDTGNGTVFITYVLTCDDVPSLTQTVVGSFQSEALYQGVNPETEQTVRQNQIASNFQLLASGTLQDFADRAKLARDENLLETDLPGVGGGSVTLSMPLYSGLVNFDWNTLYES